MAAQFHWDPDTYLEMIRAEVPSFDALQAAAVASVPFPPGSALDLGIGTGETSRRLLEAHPEARITGLDSSPEMVFRARRMGIEVRLARMEDPLPDGPWDLVIAVLSVHHLNAGQKQDLFRRVREQARSLVLADVVRAEPGATVTPIEPYPERAEDLAAWSGGEIVWREGDLAVIRAVYDAE
ncbi:MAG TPA: class I SAM-dependent methyltransferase [Solirubrobacterales bacterium]|nr:class I SAM-dependent methyltransferase [Solirubrobacterales bacterium]